MANSWAQNLENRQTGTVRNNGVIRFHSDTGTFRNAAAHTSFTNNVIEFRGTDNRFTDLSGNAMGTTALGIDRAMRIPGLVRYQRPDSVQRLQARFYTDIEVADSAMKEVPDSVFVGNRYTITLSGPRRYQGTFYYDGLSPQIITTERGLSGPYDRYQNLSLLFSTKSVPDTHEVRLSGEFDSDALSPMNISGQMYWGTRSRLRAPAQVLGNGLLTAGTDVSELYADVDVHGGTLVIPDDADTVIVMPAANIVLRASSDAKLFMGDSTRLDVLGGYVNQFPALTNAVFDTSSVVNYAGSQQPQVMQATASSNPYGHLRTAASIKSSNGNIFVASTLRVTDSNVVMIPHTLSMWTGEAIYTNDAEVVGSFRRDLTLGDTTAVYRYNNEHTHMRYSRLPTELTMDVRPITRPNAYDNTTDVFRKIRVTYQGPWRATVRAGYKANDIPSTWVPETAERLMKMYNASPPPNETAIKLTPTVPPTYARKAAVGLSLGYVELVGIENTGADNLRLDDGNDILLRASRDVLKAVAHGRWSNPFTWDEAREPEPIDRVVIDGYTVHTGFVRATDNYTINEAYPDSMSLNVVIGNLPNSSLVFGSNSTRSQFSLVPQIRVALVTSRTATSLVPVDVQDVTNNPIDGGLIVYQGSSFITPNLTLTPGATAFNGGLLQVGLP